MSISLYSTQFIGVRVRALLKDQDLLFELNHLIENLSVFTHIINCSMAEMLIWNDISNLIIINCEGSLETVIEYDEEDCFLAESDNLSIAAVSAQKNDQTTNNHCHASDDSHCQHYWYQVNEVKSPHHNSLKQRHHLQFWQFWGSSSTFGSSVSTLWIMKRVWECYKYIWITLNVYISYWWLAI